MSSDGREQPNALDKGMTRLVAGLSAGWRAVAAAFVRITPSTPPIDDEVRSGDKKSQHAKEDGI